MSFYDDAENYAFQEWWNGLSRLCMVT